VYKTFGIFTAFFSFFLPSIFVDKFTCGVACAIKENFVKKTTLSSLIALVLCSPVYAADTIDLKDMVVTASRTPQARESTIADVTVIDNEEIQRAGQSTLVEVLSRQAGIEMSSSGGAGTVSGIFIRGTNASHVVVLIDGMRVDSATLGSTAFENLPIGQIDRIEILRGPASTLYGQDAIGGVIQIFTKKGDGAPKLNASLGYGTYNTKRANAGVRGSAVDTRFALNVSSLDTNSFSAIDTKNKDYNDKDAYRNLAFSGNLSHQIEAGHEVGLQFLHSDGRVHFDNPFNGSNFDSKADSKQYSFAVFSHNQFTDLWLSKVRIGEGADESRTYDEFSVKGGDLFKTRQFQLSWQNDFKLPVGTLTLLYDNLNQKVKSTVNFTENERENDGFVASYLLNGDAHSLQLSARHDNNSQFGSHNTGSIGYGFKFNPSWRATASIGTAFKAPTFNDLYYPFFGNPNLSPEKSRNVEASLRYQADNTSASATIFHHKIRDLIGYDDAFNVMNVNKARINGLSLSASQQLGDLHLGGSVDIQSPEDEKSGNLLVRRANRHANLNANYQMADWRFGAEATASSVRYNNASNTAKLSGYALINATVNYQFAKDWSVQARANNILDKEYALGLDFGGEPYNTSGANLFINIRYQPE